MLRLMAPVVDSSSSPNTEKLFSPFQLGATCFTHTSLPKEGIHPTPSFGYVYERQRGVLVMRGRGKNTTAPKEEEERDKEVESHQSARGEEGAPFSSPPRFGPCMNV